MEIKYNKPSEDLSGIKFGDKRLDKRLKTTVESKEQQIGASILSGCGDKYAAKAFYALLSNDKFEKEKLEKEAYKSTLYRIADSGLKRVLLAQDTSDINLNGHKKSDIGYCSEHIRGISLHSCLALTPEGLPLGLISQQYETRSIKKIPLKHGEKVKRPIEEKESYRWLETSRNTLEIMPEGVESVIICDREGDFYELYSEMVSLGSLFVVRLTRNRTTVDGDLSIQQLRRTKSCGEAEVSIPRDTRKNIPARTAKMEVACCSVSVARPKHLKSDLPASLTLNLVRITEIGETAEPIEWFLATNLPIADDKDVMEIVGYYIQRWKIERFHYVLKSGCQAEKIQQRTFERIKPVLLIYSVIAVFVLAMTLMARSSEDFSCEVFLEEYEWKILYCLINKRQKPPDKPFSLKVAIAYLGELGSFKHAPSDGDYGVNAIWKGLFKLFNALDVVDRLMGQV